MLFNSIDFAIYLPLVFFIYWYFGRKEQKNQNIIIVLASYFFYGSWNWRFLFLIFLSTLTAFIVAVKMEHEKRIFNRKLLLCISLFVNISLLVFFKYCDFFIDNFIAVFLLFGLKLNISSLNIILPVGISFYTFQTLGYSIDVYKGCIKPEKDFIVFASFVSFFPQLVAGPIERASNLLPQFYQVREFKYEDAVDGCRQMLWGLFKKVVVADNCASYVNMVFNKIDGYSGSTLLLGALLFTFQIYCDFSGYSDIAIGVSKLFGIRLMKNFSYPFFSTDIIMFWRRWHISLTTWFKDYVYIPLGGNRGGGGGVITIRNIIIIFLLSGLWHGAKWTFVFWGMYHAILFIVTKLVNKNKEFNGKKIIISISRGLKILITFFLVVFGFVIFRANSLVDSYYFIKKIFSISLFSRPYIGGMARVIVFSLFSIVVLIVVEWINRHEEYGLKILPQKKLGRWAIYIIVTILIIEMGGNQQEFIYFQF